MPKSMKYLLIVSLIVLGYLFIDLHITIKTQEAEEYIVKLEVALQDAEGRAAHYSNKLNENREEINLLRDENTRMSAILEGVMYQEAQNE